MKRLTQTTAKFAVLAGIIGSGSFIAAPAMADNYSESTPTSQSNPAQPMQTEPYNPSDMSATGNIVDIASSNESFNTLTQAVQAAGLTETLSGEGPYTVFAPTDEAFAQLPEGALEFLLQPENQDLLRQVLTYHVVPGEVTSSEIATGPVEAIGGGLAVQVTDEGVVVNNASVVNPDIQASNGVIHTVNRVLLPETLQQTLESRLGEM